MKALKQIYYSVRLHCFHRECALHLELALLRQL